MPQVPREPGAVSKAVGDRRSKGRGSEGQRLVPIRGVQDQQPGACSRLQRDPREPHRKERAVRGQRRGLRAGQKSPLTQEG